MKLLTFQAADMPSALKMVREALGDNAIILANKEVQNGSRTLQQVTAAVDEDATPAPKPAKQAPAAARDNQSANDLRHDIHNILRFHNLPEVMIAKLMQTVSDNDLKTVMDLHHVGNNREPRQLHRLTLEKLLSHAFDFQPLPLDVKPTRTMLIGPPGIGKTLTIAKIASKLAMEKLPVAVVTTDNKRAGGIEQLSAFTTILGIDLKVADNVDALRQQLKVLPAFAHVLVDTAGCNPYDHQELKDTKAYATIEGIEPILVMPSGGDTLEAIDMTEQFGKLPVKRLLVTHADSTRRFGGILATAAVGGFSFCNISSSSSLVDSLQPADPKIVAQLLLRYQLHP
ncbi:MAG: hypothetical protein SFT92_05470 [Rickettsiales bacterium]|nr:hypothetical protein [Rickettsiales bacterium]